MYLPYNSKYRYLLPSLYLGRRRAVRASPPSAILHFPKSNSNPNSNLTSKLHFSSNRMPPFVPRKRSHSEDPPPAKRQALENSAKPLSIHDADSDSDSSEGDSPDDTSGAVDVAQPNDEDGDDEEEEEEDEDIDWEDAIDPRTAATAPTLAVPELQDLELTLDKNEAHVSDLLDGKKGPTKIERQIRIQSHCIHVQCLLYHNAIRNAWINDTKIHETLRHKLPEGIHKEVKKWRIATGLEIPERKPDPPKTKKKKGKQAKKKEDWGPDSERLEPGQPDMSRGDPIITLLKVLVAYWKKQFQITAPGLRKNGYRPVSSLEAVISDFRKEEHDPERHGERIANLDEFRTVAEKMQGSRDVGAQLFTALIRALGIEARLVSNLQPLGFGWTKSEVYTTPKTDSTPTKDQPENESGDSESASDVEKERPKTKKGVTSYDKDLPFPIYWTEVISPATNEVISVDSLILPKPLALSADQQEAFEPRGAKADRAKQVICYVIAHSADGTAKDVTTRYLRKRMWPGKTKGYRFPIQKLPIPGLRGQYFEYDWFRNVMRGYIKRPDQRTKADELEDETDLKRKQPEKKKSTQAGDTLQSLRTSTEFVLERFLRREEALRPGAESVRTFTSGKGARAKEELVYKRADVVKCMSAESWHKEGRQIQAGAAPLKKVPIRAVTLMRKREVDEMQRETGEKPMQGLYAREQTEYIIPPPICDGKIPKNNYGNIDCFVPSMVPRGAAHVPYPGTVRLCKKLGIDYAEAVTGFEFGSKMAVPVIQGVVVASENEDLLKDAWRIDAAEKRKREELKAEKRILQTWRKFLFGLRIAERVREEYGGGDPFADRERDAQNPFALRKKNDEEHEPDQKHDDHFGEESHDPVDHGGGFLLPGEGDDNGNDGLIVEEHKQDGHTGEDDSDDAELSPPISISSEPDVDADGDVDIKDDPESDYAPPTRRGTRRRRRGG